VKLHTANVFGPCPLLIS